MPARRRVTSTCRGTPTAQSLRREPITRLTKLFLHGTDFRKMVEILLVRRDGSEVGCRILCANERVRSASALGDVVDVALVPIGHLVQMSTPLLAYAESMYSFARVFQEICELGAVGTVAREHRRPAHRRAEDRLSPAPELRARAEPAAPSR